MIKHSRKKREKKITVWDGNLTDEQIRNFEKDHPGYRLAFGLRHPYLPVYVSLLSVLFAVVVLMIKVLL